MLPDVKEIQRRRKQLELTQKELAIKAGISQSLIAKIESEKINPSYGIVRKIFEVLEELDKGSRVKAMQIMSRHVISVRKDDKISKAVDTMRRLGYSQLPVQHRNHVVGTISEKDILNIVSNGKSLPNILEKNVEAVMTEALPMIGEEETIDVISALLQNNSAVLVAKKGKMVGIITKADLFKIAKK